MPSRDYIQKLAREKYDDRMYEAFMKSLNNISESINLDDLTAGVRSGNIDNVTRVINMQSSQFDPLRIVTSDGVNDGGAKTMTGFPAVFSGGRRIKITFEKGSRRAVSVVDNLHTNLIREITQETKVAIENHLRYGLEQGKNPKTIAQGIRGTYDYNLREYRGGVIGLTEHQENWVLNSERELRSGNPREMRKYLRKKLRDSRYDRNILKAINENKPLSEKTIRDATDAYRRKVVKYRAETIARDQSLEALSMGQDVATDQFLESGHLQEQDILQLWINSGDSRVRDTHIAVPRMNKGGVRRGNMFETPLGPLLRPRDRNSPGSVPENVIQCRCSLSIRVRRQ